MRSFEEWFGSPLETASEVAELPGDCYETKDGIIMVECCVCNQYREMICDLSEHEEGHYYCGYSPSCCP